MIRKNGRSKPYSPGTQSMDTLEKPEAGRPTLRVFRDHTGAMMVAEVVSGKKLGSRMFNLQQMFSFCANFMANEDAMMRFSSVISKNDLEIASIHKQLKMILDNMDKHYARKPRFGWSKP